MTRSSRKPRRRSPVDPMGNLGENLSAAGSAALADAIRPVTRADCKNGPRPCHNVWCRSNMIMDVMTDGAIMLNSGLPDDDRGEGAARILTDDVSDADFFAQVDVTLDWWIKRTDKAMRLGTRLPRSCLDDIIDDMQGEEMLLENVGAEMHITRERARQIEEAALLALDQSSARLDKLLRGSTARRAFHRLTLPAILPQGPPDPPLVQIRRKKPQPKTAP